MSQSRLDQIADLNRLKFNTAQKADLLGLKKKTALEYEYRERKKRGAQMQRGRPRKAGSIAAEVANHCDPEIFEVFKRMVLQERPRQKQVCKR